MAGGILLLAAITAAAGYPASALVIAGIALLRLAIGAVIDRRARAASRRLAASDPRVDDIGAFARALRDDVVGADDFLAAAEIREAHRRPRP